MIAATELRLVLVTPETTLLDQNVRSVQLPLFDGSIGILPGRAPVVGRLGRGELRFEAGGTSKSFYIEGGFLQIKGSIVTLLTNRAVDGADIDSAAAQRALDAALLMPTGTDDQYTAKLAADDAARQMLRIKRN
ncbi:MAG: ATP synthase F1 subunit epsilon [Planctomycetota bacterium]|nr:MAG: ATP synthase F1 subunit epsilon [Planctomycetota bacterium]